jgi:phosphoribosylaminoimidazole-succinocarboxamide synthase
MKNIRKRELLHEGKAKKVFRTSRKSFYIQEFKDSATAFDGTKKDTIQSKGIVNNNISSAIFKLLEAKGIRTHFVEQIDDRQMLIKPVEIIKTEVVARNVAAGSLVRRLGFTEGKILEPPIIEFYLKDDSLHDPLITDDHAIHLGLATKKELNFMRNSTLHINDILKEFFLSINLTLVDFKLEFGRHGKKILLADEISPDTCRLWDAKTGEKLDKDRFRFDLGNVEDAYREVFRRVTGKEIQA